MGANRGTTCRHTHQTSQGRGMVEHCPKPHSTYFSRGDRFQILYREFSFVTSVKLEVFSFRNSPLCGGACVWSEHRKRTEFREARLGRLCFRLLVAN